MHDIRLFYSKYQLSVLEACFYQSITDRISDLRSRLNEERLPWGENLWSHPWPWCLGNEHPLLPYTAALPLPSHILFLLPSIHLFQSPLKRNHSINFTSFDWEF